MEQFSRIVRMLDQEWLDKLQTKKVAVFGLGGVGSYVVEALVRNGIGEIVLVDHDVIDITNLNRQLYALHSTIGMNIFKSANIFAFCEFFTKDLDYSWVIGKLIGAIIVLFGMTVFKSSLIYYKNEVKRYDN